jgi:hypothetical protein
MTPEEVERVKVLCQQIAVEEDRHKFSQLIAELNDLLERKTERFDHHLPTGPK